MKNQIDLIRRAWALAILLILFAPPTFGATRAASGKPDAKRPPNIVLIFADDLGYGDLGSFGARQIKTPNLDRMAREGVRLTNFYVTASVCTPSRAGLLTGRYQIRSGLTRVLFPASRDGIGAEEMTLAEALRGRGYRTACVGKWHLGHLPQFLPTAHGFDYYFGIPYSNDMAREERSEPPVPLMRDTEIVEQPAVQETLTERYTEEAIKFIRESKDRPFFLYLPHTMPHVPIFASARFRGRSAAGLYGDVVETIDWSAGEIVKTLAELGLEKNTLVIFTSDNGPWLIKKEDAGSAGPLRDGKQTLYEGGIRVPFIARWPGTIRSGLVSDRAAITLDLFPTLLHLAGGKISKERPSDGMDIRALLTGRGKRAKEEFYFYQNEQLLAVRSGNWKLHLARRVQDKDHPAELYDLMSDPGESKNLAPQHPELVARLTAQAQAFDAEARRSAAPLKR